jgi:hypothetical protein
MFFGHDYGWWGFWIGMPLAFLSFLGMIFLWLFGDRLRERILNWWAVRSVTSLRLRIKELEGKLADYRENYELMPAEQEWMLRGIATLIDIGQLLLLIVSSGFLTVAMQRLPGDVDKLNLLEWLSISKLNTHASLTFVPISLTCLLFVALVDRVELRPLRAYIRPRSERIRRSIELSIDNLRSKLAERS